MAKYIDREAFMQSMYHEAFEKDSDLQKWDGGCWIRYKLLENVMSATPPADVRPVVHGKWIFDCERKMHDGWTYRQYHCSACEFQMIGGSHNFCPNCGADMREEI